MEDSSRRSSPKDTELRLDGNLTSVTHFNGATTTYTYDNLNRILSARRRARLR